MQTIIDKIKLEIDAEEDQVTAEKLAGNIVKENLSRGVIAGLTVALNIITSQPANKPVPNNKEEVMDNLARRVLLRYCQSWGQTAEEKIEVLNEAVKAAGINAVFKQYEEDGELVAGWEGSKEDTKKASQFRRDLETDWWKGCFEEEAAFISGLIAKYANQSLNQTKAG